MKNGAMILVCDNFSNTIELSNNIIISRNYFEIFVVHKTIQFVQQIALQLNITVKFPYKTMRVLNIVLL